MLCRNTIVFYLPFLASSQNIPPKLHKKIDGLPIASTHDSHIPNIISNVTYTIIYDIFSKTL